MMPVPKMRIAYDTVPLRLSTAGELRYASELRSALLRREDIDLVDLEPSSRRPRTLAQRVLAQAVVEAVFYPLVARGRAERADVDVIHHPRHLVPPGIGARDTPTLLTLHDVFPLRYPELFTPVIGAHHRLLTAPAARRAERVITGSEYSRAEIAELTGVSPERIVVTPYGIDERFVPTTPDRPWLAERFGIDRPYVLCVGTLEPRKNLVAALDAFELLLREDSGHKLVITGGRGWRHGVFEERLARMGDSVVLTGFVADHELVALLGAAACFVHPALYEGFGFPVLEAMACGAPVVASDGGSIPELAGAAATLVDARDAPALADGIRRVLGTEALAAELRRHGLERARRYSWDACAEATVAIYASAVR